jgi:sodium-dependent dicarboxylate transporter 2/3/5
MTTTSGQERAFTRADRVAAEDGEAAAPEKHTAYRPVQRIGLLAGGALFLLLLVLPPPPGLPQEGWRTAAVSILMAVWWMTEALPIPATALLPLVLFPLLGVLPMTGAAAPYANELIFLFMGGFVLAVAMQRWGLHRRIALSIMAAVGTGPKTVVLGFLLATAFLSMWISNTAATAMMLPIALAVGSMFRPADLAADRPYNLGICLMLAVAYGSTLGGVSTLIGTPPNAVLAGAASEMLGVRIGFVDWMIVGVPVAGLFLPVVWVLLVHVIYPTGEIAGDASAMIAEERLSLGRASRGEKVVAAVFALTALAWVMRDPKDFGAFTVPGITTFAPNVQDSTIAIAAALALFLTPVDWKKGVFAVGWEQVRNIPWGVLVLFGGGLSLARAMEQSGLAAWIGGGVSQLAGVPTVLIIVAVATLFIFLTEITSNTATATMAMPIVAGAAAGLGIQPLGLMAAAALSCSMAFMLPVATPPNAIVFASDYLTIPQMAKAGLWMNIIAIAMVTTAATLLVPLALLR